MLNSLVHNISSKLTKRTRLIIASGLVSGVEKIVSNEAHFRSAISGGLFFCDSDSSQTSSGEPVRVVRQFIFKDIFI
jgi:hypothetical protein